MSFAWCVIVLRRGLHRREMGDRRDAALKLFSSSSRVLIAFLVLLPIVRHHSSPSATSIANAGSKFLIIGGIGLAITQGLMYTGAGIRDRDQCRPHLR